MYLQILILTHATTHSLDVSTNLKNENYIETENDINGFNSAIKWWERKRVFYNVVTFLGGLIVIFLRGEVPNGISSYTDFGIIFFWLFGANIFYTCGWAFEAMLNYYFKIPFWNNNVRRVLFFLGLVFSFIWMFLLTREIN